MSVSSQCVRASLVALAFLACAEGSKLGAGPTAGYDSGAAPADGAAGSSAGGAGGVGGSGGFTSGTGGATGGNAGSSPVPDAAPDADPEGGTSAGGTSSLDAGAVDGGVSCPAGQKPCGGICVTPSYTLGCSLTDCTPCSPPPANGTGTCNASACDFSCNTGYEKNGSQCTPECAPLTCSSVGRCGSFDDGCGGTLMCTCASPHTCGGGCVADRCGSDEVCNGADDDIDGLIDEPSPASNGQCTPCRSLENGGFVYWFCTNEREWLEAENYCVSLGAHLASIADATENDFIRSTMGGSERFWIGMNDRSSENSWRWSDGVSVAYTNFACAAGTPNTGDEDCATMDTGTGCWDDDDCAQQLFGSNRNYRFVCKAPVPACN